MFKQHDVFTLLVNFQGIIDILYLLVRKPGEINGVFIQFRILGTSVVFFKSNSKASSSFKNREEIFFEVRCESSNKNTRGGFPKISTPFCFEFSEVWCLMS